MTRENELAKLTRSEIEDLKNEICPENGWIEKEIPRFHALCDMALAALSGVRVPVEQCSYEPDDNLNCYNCGEGISHPSHAEYHLSPAEQGVRGRGRMSDH